MDAHTVHLAMAALVGVSVVAVLAYYMHRKMCWRDCWISPARSSRTAVPMAAVFRCILRGVVAAQGGRGTAIAGVTNIQLVTSGDTPYTSAATFEDLSLSPELLKGLYVEMKFQKPSKIQAISLPMILNPPHGDLIAQAHNGSEKTTCFVLGMSSRVD